MVQLWLDLILKVLSNLNNSLTLSLLINHYSTTLTTIQIRSCWGALVAARIWRTRPGNWEGLRQCVHPAVEVSIVTASRSSFCTTKQTNLWNSQAEHLVSSVSCWFSPKTWPGFKEEPREKCHLFLSYSTLHFFMVTYFVTARIDTGGFHKEIKRYFSLKLFGH